MKTAEDLALRFAALVAQEREAEAGLAKVRAEKENALKRLLAFKPTNGASDGGAKEKVAELLDAEPHRVFSTAEVAIALGMAGNVASAYLSELYNKDRRIARLSKGQYQSLKGRPLPLATLPDESLTTEQ